VLEHGRFTVAKGRKEEVEFVTRFRSSVSDCTPVSFSTGRRPDCSYKRRLVIEHLRDDYRRKGPPKQYGVPYFEEHPDDGLTDSTTTLLYRSECPGFR
jgi:hypothetical protein